MTGQDWGADVFIDWITLSFGRLDQKDARDTIYNHLRSLQKIYPKAFTMQTFGTLSVCFPGQFWQGVTESDGLSLVDDVSRWCSTGRVSRVDFAHDWNLDEVSATPIWWAVGSLPNVTRLEGPSGRTWYVGSRESERFARLYDKSAEIRARIGFDIGFPILRFEFEAKHACAREYLDHYRRCPDVVQGDIAKRYNLTEFMSGSSTDVIRVHGAPVVDPFAFVHQFRRAITRARNDNPTLFDELCPVSSGTGDTVKPPDGAS